MNTNNRINTNQGAKQPPSFVPSNQTHPTAAASSGLSGTNLPHLTNSSPLAFAEDCVNSKQWQLNTRFSYSQAIVWQIKFIISSFLTKKTAGAAQAELQYLSEKFGTDFDKYLIRELVEQIDLKDPNKVSKDKNEAVKSQLLAQELSRMCLKPDFLKYFSEIAQGVFGDRYADFTAELSRRLKLSSKMQLMVALSLAESCPETHKQESYAILKQKLVEYYQGSRQEALEDYAVHRLSYILSVYPEFSDDNPRPENPPNFLNAVAQFKAQTTKKQNMNLLALRVNLGDGDLLSQNPSPEDPSCSLIKMGSDFDNLCKISRVLQPWEVICDLGYFSNFDYQVLTMVLQDFKDINERTMANTILHLALNNQGEEQAQSRIAFNVFKSNKTGDPLKKEPIDKTATMQWHADPQHFSRAFRENYSNLNWLKVFESFGDLDEEIDGRIKLEPHQFDTLIQIYNKSKPQNLQIPISALLEKEWKNPHFQFTMIQNAIQAYLAEKDRSFNFNRSSRKIQLMNEVPLSQEVPTVFIDVWSSPEVIEVLFKLSKHGLYHEVRSLVQAPMTKMPEYFLFAISKANFEPGCFILDDVLSTLMPTFLINQQAIVFLKRLWDFNQNMMIRAICECCRHEQRIMNLSRVLDITQDIKDSLIKIVYCNDFDFAVNLGILAGKREFLHYDVWLKERIKKVGTPFVQAFIKYINEQIIIPCKEFMIQGGYVHKQLTPEDQDAIDKAREIILERSHMSKERLCMTMEHLENPANFQSLTQSPSQFEQLPNFPQEVQNILVKISHEVQEQIKDLVAQYTILFPRQVGPTQSTEEIDKAANEYFQHIFSAEPHEVDERIQELIVTLQSFQKSQVVKEQEIYACVLHGLFDEYRFLHKYPHVYLTKIAKLFGAIIKNRLLNNVLQGIALKFVIEAFRRDGKRLMFGIIVVKEFLECLPEFPKQFQEIYQNREKIQQKDPELFQKIEHLYKQTMMHLEPDTEAGSSHSEYPEEAQNTSSISFNEIQESKGLGSDADMFSGFEKNQAKEMKDEVKKDSTKANVKQDQPNTEFTLSEAQNQPNTFKQMGTNSSTFVPSTNMANKAASLKVNPKQQQPINQNRKISPQVNTQPPFVQQPANLSNVNRAQQDKKLQTPLPTNTSRPESLDNNSFAINPIPLPLPLPLGSNLNAASAPFMRVENPIIGQSNPGIVQQDLQAAKNRPNPQILNSVVNNQTIKQPVPPIYIQQKPVPPIQMVTGLMPINIKAKSFRPSDFNPGVLGMASIVQFQPNPQHIAWQKIIDQKIEEAKINKQHRLRFEDLIEDLTLEQPPQNVIDQIKLKCNNTGKNNFKQNLESIKELVITKAEENRLKYQEEGKEIDDKKDAKDVNLTWFINYILTKRISGQNQTLYHIYIELIRQIGHPDAISRTILIASEIFQRCMLIDELEFNKVANKVGGTSGTLSQIKAYLKTLGQFLGQLTLGRNRPIRIDELDIKQLIIQGFQHENRKLVISFACNIIKECQKSVVFKIQNPWLNGILQVLREVIDLLQMPNMKMLKDKEEIESELVFLFKSFNINNINEIIPSGTLKASQGSQFVSVSQEIELSFLASKKSLIPIRQKTVTQNQQAPDGPESDQINGQKSLADSEWENFVQTLSHLQMSQQRLENFKFIYTNVAIQEDKRNFLKSKFLLDDCDINEFVTKAVEESIEEILKPVVDRSVTIALITTKELVLKDFAYDGDCDRISDASEQIIQSLAGSLALVTCREPLRLQLNNFLLKALKQSCFNAGTPTGLRRAQILDGMTLEEKDRQNKQEQYLNYYMQDVEEQLNEIAHETAKENLELGCKMIKNAVITKAHTQVKEDKVLYNALEKRRRAQELGETTFYDDQMSVKINELPVQLRPNPNGLTEDQFKVYKDFAKLNYKSKFDQVNIGSVQNENTEQQVHPKQTPPAQYEFTIESLLGRMVEEKPLDSVTRSLMTIKLSQIKSAANQEEVAREKTALWSYCESSFQTLVSLCESKQIVLAKNIAEKIRLVVTHLPTENFGGRLLREAFLEMEEMYILNTDMNVLLLQNKIFPVLEWDKAIASYISDCSGGLQSKAFEFVSDVVKKCVFSAKLFTHELIPNIVRLLQAVTDKIDQHSEMLKFYVSDVFEQLKGQIPSDYENRLREYFKKWVELSQIEDSAAQEREMNRFFNEMSSLGIERDEELLFVFCKIMIKESIELAQHTKTGEKRLNNYTLDYRFIDSFIKLVLCLLTSSDLNKTQFMSKIFEFIRQKLDDDHFSQQKTFNQKPYYRILMNILRAVTMSECFNVKTQHKILYDLADLFKDLNPNNYPAFAFAWLALISNQLFMPHFIKVAPNLIQLDRLVTESYSEITQGKVNKGEKGSQQSNMQELESQLQRLYKMKDLLVNCFTFIKTNFMPGQQASPAMRSFYTATMNVVLVILKDYPQFLCDFHFNFVNALPDHAIQLKNLVLTAFPKSVHPPPPFSQGLKVDPMQDQQDPRILSNFQDYIKLNGLKDHINDYFTHSSQLLINDICLKMMSSKEKINGKVVPQSSVINAVVLCIATKVCSEKTKENAQANERESIELFKQITINLNDETRLCFLNSIVNELRYPNSHTFFFCIILLRLFAESKPNIQEQISTIFFERLQTLRPYPWGLMINFRELIQNQKYGFTKSVFITQNQEAVKTLLANKERLRPYLHFMPAKQHPPIQTMVPQSSYPSSGVQMQQFAQFSQSNQQMNAQPPSQFMRSQSTGFQNIAGIPTFQQQRNGAEISSPDRRVPNFMGSNEKKSPF